MKEDKYKNLLNKKGIRATEQRLEIIKILDNGNKPLTALEIHEFLVKNNINIRLSTVYRNLKFFMKNNILRQLNFYSDEKRYELMRKKHHQHLICMKCGEILAIECPLGEYEKELEEKTNYKIKKHDMEMYGICPKCQKK